MKRVMMVLLVCVGALAAFAAAEGSRTGVVEWTFPRLGGCHEGLAFADGVTGVLVWGGGDAINLTVGRADMWDHRGGYPWTVEQSYTNIVAAVRSEDTERLLGLFKKTTPKGEPRNPYMLPLGRVVVKVPGKTLKRGSLDPFTGLGEIEFAEGGKVELAMSKKDHAFAMRFPEGVAYTVKSVPATDHPVYERELKPVGFEKAVVADGADAGGFRWKLPADAPVWLSWRKTGREIALASGRDDKVASDRPAFDAVAAASVAYWKAFWNEGARVTVPDPVVQRAFAYGMYRFGAMTDPDGVAAGLQGPWLEDDKLVPWNGDYHFNINVQECYSPAYRGGHFANLMPLFKMVLSWRPLLKDNARKFVGVDHGYVLPHSVDDRGVCIGGFWTGTIDHASTAWVAAMMFRYVKYSRDVAFLRNGGYDFMKGAMNVYRAMMEEKDGRLSLPIGPSPEWSGALAKGSVGRDPSFQLAAAHRLARDLVAAAKLLGEAPDPMWLDVEKRLPLYTVAPSACWAGGDEIALFGGQTLTESHRHHSHMAGLYPFDVIDVEDPKTRPVIDATYFNWQWRGTGGWSGWCVPWASILNTHLGNPVAAVHMLRTWDAFYTNPGHGSRHDVYHPGVSTMRRGGHWNKAGVAGDPPGEEIMQMDGACAAATAVMELMVHEVNGKVEYFRGCPEEWRDVSFENVALSDGRRVSGRRVDGKTEIKVVP